MPTTPKYSSGDLIKFPNDPKAPTGTWIVRGIHEDGAIRNYVLESTAAGKPTMQYPVDLQHQMLKAD